MAKWVDEGENQIARVYFGGSGALTSDNIVLEMGLYTDGAEPAETANLASITEVTLQGGYARKTLTRGSWAISNDEATFAEQTFEKSGGASWGNVTGYFIAETGADSGDKLVAVEQFSNGPYTVENDGDQIKITPKVTIA